MTQLHHRAAARVDVKWALVRHIAAVRRFFRRLHRHLLATCTFLVHPQRYRRLKAFLSRTGEPAVRAPAPQPDAGSELVELKICLLGDCHVGKTTFMERYVGDAEEHRRGLELQGLNLMERTFPVGGGSTCISFNLWDVAGDRGFLHHIPMACKDAAAILFMFDLTRRRTLRNVVYWYHQWIKWNKTAIPIMVGTKFDEFAQLPLDMQWTIINEARTYARAMGAALFFSSATHDINVSKIFKFIAAKIFNLTWAPQRNLTIGEPIIDY